MKKDRDIRIPAGVKVLKVFYLLLFWTNIVALLFFYEITSTKVCGQPLDGGLDLMAKLVLILVPLAIYIFGFMMLKVAGCYIAIAYQIVFLANTFLTIANDIFGLHNIEPIIQIIKKYSVPIGSINLKNSFVYTFNAIFGAACIYYLISKIGWWKDRDKKYKGHDDRAAERHEKKIGITYSTGDIRMGIKVKAESNDISIGGIRFTPKEALKEGAVINVELMLEGEEKPVRSKARVAWVRDKECGLKFLRMNGFDKKRLKNFLRD